MSGLRAGGLAKLLSRQLAGPRSDALATAGDAMISACHLWADDDDAMFIGCRAVLEQTARSRAWRENRDRAQLTEARQGKQRWLEFRYKAYSPLARALDAFSHNHLAQGRVEAREALGRLLGQPITDGADGQSIVRGRSLTYRTAHMILVQELFALVQATYPNADEGALERLFGVRKAEVKASENWLRNLVGSNRARIST